MELASRETQREFSATNAVGPKRGRLQTFVIEGVEGPAAELFANPRSDYTRALFAAAFNLETAPEGVVAQ